MGASFVREKEVGDSAEGFEPPYDLQKQSYTPVYIHQYNHAAKVDNKINTKI